MELLWTQRALRRLDEIGAYISLDNPAAAARVISRIIYAVDRLREFPNSGRPGRKKNSREIVLPDMPYIVAYRIVRSQVQITAVFHAAQRRPLKL